MRQIILREFEPTTMQVAARVRNHLGEVVAVVNDPVSTAKVDQFREAIVTAVFGEDFGDAILAGVAFEIRWGGGAVGFT